MSNFYRFAKHPKTGKWERAYWVDDYYGRHNYGVIFNSDGSVYDPWATGLVQEINEKEAEILNNALKDNP